jgi:hypothetical protein
MFYGQTFILLLQDLKAIFVGVVVREGGFSTPHFFDFKIGRLRKVLFWQCYSYGHFYKNYFNVK